MQKKSNYLLTLLIILCTATLIILENIHYQKIKSKINKRLSRLDDKISTIINLVPEDQILEQTKMSQSAVNDLYQMLKDTHEILQASNIEYSIAFGTLLGSARNNGLIPWDDDADIVIKEEYAEKLHSLEPIFNKLGYEFKPCTTKEGICKIYKKGNPTCSVETDADKKCSLTYNRKCTTTFPFIDIFILRKNKAKNIWEIKDDQHRAGFPNHYFIDEELSQPKLYSFGPIKLNGPTSLSSYLARAYGPNFMNEIVISHAHCFSQKTIKLRRPATKALLRPYLPSIELLDKNIK